MKKILSLLVFVPLLTACDFHDAELETHWTFDGMGCRAAGVSFVEVVLEDRHGDVYESGLVPCHEGSVIFTDLPEGRARIWAFGYDSPARGYTWELYTKIRVLEGYDEVTLDLAPAY